MRLHPEKAETMGDRKGYAVFLYEKSLETLGDAIKPYLCEGPHGCHVSCREVDTSGGFVEMLLDGRDESGRTIDLELIVPTNMIRMIVSARADEAFGFAPRNAVPLEPSLPAVGPTAAPAKARSEALPDAESQGGTAPAPDKS
jgi:hypothetical protein